MVLTVKEKDYTLRLLCGKFRELKDKIKSDNLMQSIMEAAQNADVEVMAKCIQVVALEPKLTETAALALMDDYIEESNEHTVMTFGMKLLEVFDEAGFLPKKGIAKDISEQMNKAMSSLNFGEIMKTETPTT